MKISPKTGHCLPAVSGTALFKKCLTVCVMLGVLLALGTTRVLAQDDDYLAVYGIIDQADSLNASGKTVQAHNKYVEAK